MEKNMVCSMLSGLHIYSYIDTGIEMYIDI